MYLAGLFNLEDPCGCSVLMWERGRDGHQYLHIVSVCSWHSVKVMVRNAWNTVHISEFPTLVALMMK